MRKKQNLLQIDLAIMVGIDRAYLSEIENGRTNVSINLLYAIADALKEPIKNIVPDWFFYVFVEDKFKNILTMANIWLIYDCCQLTGP